MELAARFILGGLIVSLFALLGDVLEPKSFAGLFGAAPSVAVATLGLTLLADGKGYAALEARSMILGGLAFMLYASGCVYLMGKKHVRAIPASLGLLPVWIGIALGLKWAVFG